MLDDYFHRIAFKPQRSLGQNFLNSKFHLEKIVSFCNINSQTRIIEIGSGYGALTSFLIEASPFSIISIEKDRLLFE